MHQLDKIKDLIAVLQYLFNIIGLLQVLEMLYANFLQLNVRHCNVHFIFSAGIWKVSVGIIFVCTPFN